MYWLISAIALQTVFEWLLCSGHITLRLRKLLAVVLMLSLLAIAFSVVKDDWHLWLWPMLLMPYRLINMLRVAAARLPEKHLVAVASQSFGWLVATQIVLFAFANSIDAYNLGDHALAALAAAQLLVAVTLLRVSVHTWRFAHVAAPTITLTNAELPTVSVLIPARNETEDLETCLTALIASDYPKLEILVLDDCSANKRTPEIIRSFAHSGVRFLQGTAPDERHWLAKNHAYNQLSREATGQLLLFCGVDTALQPNSIRRLVTLMAERQKDMVSIMPIRSAGNNRGNSVLQAVRYYWEICLPRRIFKRPPVLSTCWMIRRSLLEQIGSFDSVRRSVRPEATFAQRAVVTDAYSFLRSDEILGVYSNKHANAQYDTSIRVRYPQLHRRLELVALAALFEITFLLGPVIGMLMSPLLLHAMAYMAIWGVSLACLLVTYSLVSVGPRLTSPLFGWMLMPAAFVVDLVIMHISLWKYEFSSVNWKGRNICLPVMQVEPRLPKI